MVWQAWCKLIPSPPASVGHNEHRVGGEAFDISALLLQRHTPVDLDNPGIGIGAFQCVDKVFLRRAVFSIDEQFVTLVVNWLNYVLEQLS